MDYSKPPQANVIPFANRNNHISPLNLDNLMEDLDDMGYLSEKGIKFRTAFWKLFIKR